MKIILRGVCIELGLGRIEVPPTTIAIHTSLKTFSRGTNPAGSELDEEPIND